MRVTEEIDAMETMAIDPVHFLVAPKFLAMVIMLPCLTIWANTMGIVGGALFGVAQADFTWLAIHAGFDRCAVHARHNHRADQERDVRHDDHGGWLS